MNLLPSALRRREQRDILPFDLDTLASYFTYNGQLQMALQQTLVGTKAEVGSTWPNWASSMIASNGPAFTCFLVRMLLFSEARFQFREIQEGQPGNLFDTQRRLQILRAPWPNGTTGDLLARIELDNTAAGNFYATIRNGMIKRLRPDWVYILMGSRSDPEVAAEDLDAELLGYAYYPGGKGSGRSPVLLERDQVCHYAPIPDPSAVYRGMSWLSPLIAEVGADSQMQQFKNNFFVNGATPNMVVKIDAANLDLFNEWVKTIEEKHAGTANAYRTLFIGAGADATVVGKDLQQIDFSAVQASGEERICAAAGVPTQMAGLAGGSNPTYENFGQARRRFADGTMRPLWRNVCASLSTLISVPPGAELWYDTRDIAFLREDESDAATIQHTQAQSIQYLIMAGYSADSVVDAITSGDLTRLSHTGLTSVQLQPPASGDQVSPADNAGRALAAWMAQYLPEGANSGS